MVKEINYNLNLGSRQPILVEGVTIPFTGLKTIEFKGRSFSIPENTKEREEIIGNRYPFDPYQ